ncbi:hypothetical protein HDK90DRAFT_547193 [Phyllosticta capitalensis]|uniref:Uncharacterized protein n=1 Tax=Phyllosticta capitalensis TaxID=121624 RepID=A0ABR1Z0F4_9PEZI
MTAGRRAAQRLPQEDFAYQTESKQKRAKNKLDLDGLEPESSPRNEQSIFHAAKRPNLLEDRPAKSIYKVTLIGRLSERLLHCLFHLSEKQRAHDRPSSLLVGAPTHKPNFHYTGGDALIYTQVARHFVKRQGHTAAILLAARTEERAGLPSWVPNWGHWSAEVPPWVMRAVKAERESLEIWRRYKVNQQRLTVPGVQLERIERCADAASVGDLRKYHVSLGIGELEYFSMKIALSAHGRPRVVHQNACPGDYICRLENCTLPVVLRRVSKDDFKYVGEVLREEKDDTERYWADFGFEKGMKMDEIVIG